MQDRPKVDLQIIAKPWTVNGAWYGHVSLWLPRLLNSDASVVVALFFFHL